MKRPLQNLFSLLSGDLGGRFLGFLITVYLARVLEPSGFGIMSVGLAVLGYLQLAGSAGIPILELRNVAAAVEVNHVRIGAVLSLRVILAAVLWIVTAAAAFVCIADDITRDVILLFAFSVFPIALMLDWFFQGKEQFLATSFARIVQYVVYGVAVVLLVHGAEDIRQAGIAFCCGIMASTAVFWILYTKRWGSIRLQWAPAMWKEILSKGLPVGTAMFFAQSITNLPPLVIGYYSSVVEVGLFSSAMKVIFLMLLVDRLFNALFLPVVTRYFSTQAGEVQALVEVTLRVVLAIVLPLAVVGIIVGRESIMFALGMEYEGATVLFRVLMGYFVLTVLNSVLVCIVIGSGHERRYTKMMMIGSVVLCVAISAGTMWFGVIGTAYAVVLGELVTVILMMIEAKNLVRFSLISIVTAPLIAGGCMAGIALFIRDWNIIIVSAVSLFVFIGIEILLKGVTTRDIQFVRQRFV